MISNGNGKALQIVHSIAIRIQLLDCLFFAVFIPFFKSQFDIIKVIIHIIDETHRYSDY